MSNDSFKWKMIEVDIDYIRLISTYNVTFNGFCRKDYFYEAEDYEGTRYIINTSKRLYPHIRIKARIRKIGIYNNRGEIKLTHITILKNLKK